MTCRIKTGTKNFYLRPNPLRFHSSVNLSKTLSSMLSHVDHHECLGNSMRTSAITVVFD